MAQINPTVGDISGNVEKIKGFITRAKRKRADLIVFPELSILGYPPMDLLEKESFIKNNLSAVETLATYAPEVGVIIGFVKKNQCPPGMPLMNCAGVLYRGKLIFTRVNHFFLPMIYSMRRDTFNLLLK